MNFNVKKDKIDQTVVFFIKKDPYKPFGDFAIEVISTTLKDYEAQYHSNNLMFNQSVRPLVLEVYKSSSGDKKASKERPEEPTSHSEVKDSQDETANTDPKVSESSVDTRPAVRDESHSP